MMTSALIDEMFTKIDRFIDRLKCKTKKIIVFVVKPTSSLLYYWTALVCIGCFYNLLMVVIFVYREIYTYYFYYWLTCNFIFDIIFLIDIFIQSRISYIDDGVAAENLRVQARRYFHSYNFWLDVSSIFPFDFLLIYRSDISLVRLNRLLKSYHFNYFIDRTEIRTNWPNAFKIFVLIMTCVVLFHWNAAAYFLISVTSGIYSEDPDAWQFTYTKIADPVIPKCNTFQLTSDSTNCGFNETGRNVNNRLEYIDEMMQYWRNRSKILTFPNFSKEYALSIYWSSLTLTTKGQQPYPMSSLEDTLEVIDTLIGLLIFAVIVGSVGSVISTMNKEKSEFQEILDGIKFYMNYRKVDSDIQKRVLNCCDYIHDQGISKDESALLDGLPRKLHGQLATHLHMVTLQQVELLKDCEQGLLFELILRLKFQLFSPNDYICRRGELAREMYIVKRGQLNCVSDDGKVVLGILKEGAVFGQLAILNLSEKIGCNKHTMAIRSIGYTDVYILRQEDVNDVLQEYPLARRNLTEKAIQMLRDDGYWNNTIAIEKKVYGSTSTLEEQLDEIGKTINALGDEINRLYEMFDNMSSDFKQRLTRLEGAYKTRCERQKMRRQFVIKHKH
ncbi:Cyclic nucleotide-binding domain family protein [Acanthocheilonema viteae]